MTTIILSLGIAGAIFIAYAMAWADSIAGIIPSVLAKYSKALTASSSLIATYSARLPVSYTHLRNCLSGGFKKC